MKEFKLSRYKKLKIKISNFIFRLFKKPYYDFCEKQKKIKYDKYIRHDFIAQFGVHPDKIKAEIENIERIRLGDIHTKNGKPRIKMTDEEYQKFITHQLSQNAIESNKKKLYVKASIFYDPEITDIHNEAIKDKKSLTLNELIDIQVKDDILNLKQQQFILDKPKLNKIKTPFKYIEQLDDNISNTTELFF